MEGYNNQKANLGTRAQSEEDEAVKRRIVETFVERAKEVGVRAVSTDEIAKSLSISKKTLYKIFRSKEELVREVMDRWEARLKKPLDLSRVTDPRRVVQRSVARWYDNDAQFAPVFWEDVANDYPALRERYFDVMFDKMRDVGSHLAEYRKPGMSKEFGLRIYMLLMLNAPQPEFYGKARMSRRDAVMKALDVWLDGVFDLPDSPDGNRTMEDSSEQQSG